MNFLRVIFISLLVLVSACNTVPKTTLRTFGGAESIIKKQPNILVMPAEVQVNMVDVGNKKTRMYDYEYSLEDLIKQEFISAFKERGYRPKLFRRKDLHDKKLSRKALDLRRGYESKRRTMYSTLLKPEEKALNEKYNVGKAAAELSKKSDGEIFLMIDYAGFVKTTGARTRDFALDILSAALGGSGSSSAVVDSTVIYIGLVDAKTGNILWANVASDSKGIYGSAFDNLSSQKDVDTKRVRKIVKKILKDFPSKNESVASVK